MQLNPRDMNSCVCISNIHIHIYDRVFICIHTGSQGEILKSVVEQSELEFIEKAMAESLHDTSQVTEDALVQQALNASLT